MENNSEKERQRRIGFAPQPVAFSQIEANRVISVRLGKDEEVEWTWTYWPDGGSSVTGYTIFKKMGQTHEQNPHKSSSSRRFAKKRKLKRMLKFGLL